MEPSELAQKLLILADERAAERFAASRIARQDAGRLLSVERLGDYLDHPLARYPQVRVAHLGRAVRSGEYVTKRRIGTQTVDDGVDARRVARWLTQGATVTLDSLEYFSSDVREICRVLTESMGLVATATAYMTGPGRQGLSPHTDEEDVFVLQTSGTKEWLIDSGQRQDIPTAAAFSMNDEMRDVAPRVMNPGDMFYMPAGTPHVATSRDDLSIHITFSVERPRIRDVLKKSIDAAATTSVDLNQLQPWDDGARPTLGDMLRMVDFGDSGQQASVETGVDGLPFASWGVLGAEELDVQPRSHVRFESLEEGYAVQFPDFLMKVPRELGIELHPLSSGETVRLRPDQQSREILFHLIGRGVVLVVPSETS